MLKCTYLHYNYPYLKIGPFKYEPLSENPHVAIFRDFYSSEDCDELIQFTHGKLHSTEYKVASHSILMYEKYYIFFLEINVMFRLKTVQGFTLPKESVNVIM